MMIRRCTPTELDQVGTIVNDAAQAYRGVIAADCWKEPYMSSTDLRNEVNDGVVFWGAFEGDELVAVMGLQHVGDVALVRHAYTRTARQGSGMGKALLAHVGAQTDRPLLVGTWTAASWAIRFYENHGFRLVSRADTEVLLRRYWTIPERQINESVVLADARWLATACDSRGEHV
jgi:GNAT superfamily N-acetyltransferase